MLRAALAALLCLILLSAPAAARGGPSTKRVSVYVVVPAEYTSTVTPAQATQAIPVWLDEINAWFRRELGKVFDSELHVVNAGPNFGGPTDACGSFSGGGVGVGVPSVIQAAGYPIRNERYIALVMGAGGWAGHLFDKKSNGDRYGVVGDWGVMEEFGVPNACIPEWDYPNRGFSHEFAGMMGMYVGGGCYEDGGQGCFVGDPMSEVEKDALLRYSGGWLRSP